MFKQFSLPSPLLGRSPPSFPTLFLFPSFFLRWAHHFFSTLALSAHARIFSRRALSLPRQRATCRLCSLSPSAFRAHHRSTVAIPLSRQRCQNPARAVYGVAPQSLSSSQWRPSFPLSQARHQPPDAVHLPLTPAWQ